MLDTFVLGAILLHNVCGWPHCLATSVHAQLGAACVGRDIAHVLRSIVTALVQLGIRFKVSKRKIILRSLRLSYMYLGFRALGYKRAFEMLQHSQLHIMGCVSKCSGPVVTIRIQRDL